MHRLRELMHHAVNTLVGQSHAKGQMTWAVMQREIAGLLADTAVAVGVEHDAAASHKCWKRYSEMMLTSCC